VILNLRKLGAEVFPVSLIGEDESGRVLSEILAREKISLDGVMTPAGFRTALKSRILAGAENTRKQQILRIDSIFRDTISEEVYGRLLERLCGLAAGCDLLIVSDYLSQAVRPDLFDRLRSLFPQKLITLDSRKRLLFFRKAGYLTPNESELRALFPGRCFAGSGDFRDAMLELRRQTESSGIVLKRGHKGMVVFDGSDFREIGIHGSSEIVDVTGAGDTVLAVLSLALAAGADLFQAAELANVAGGLVVMKEGAYALSRSELQGALS
jgi:rfaE bifunctional protein kinase chain/domain